jgi:hypothetical protein
MNIFIITSTWKFNKNIRVMLSRKMRTLHLTGFAYISVNIFKVKLVVSFCYLSVVSDSCELCLERGVSISRIPKTK